MGTSPKKLSIIGGGKVGRAFGRLWAENGYFAVCDVLDRSAASAEQAAAFIGAGRAISDYAEMRPSDVWLLTVPDDTIAAACAALAATGLLNAGSVVFHCSGASSAQLLELAAARGAAVASIHPIRSFARPEQVVREFAGTWCGAEGDRRALDALSPAFAAIGARLVEIASDKKVLYHAAAVFACNYLVTLQDVAQRAYIEAGIAPEVALSMLEPLVRETVDNVFKLGPAAALTGPIARGDLGTVGRQQQAVSDWNQAYGKLYRELAERTAELAAQRHNGKNTGKTMEKN